MTTIPIVIICYNNYKYVKNTCEQIKLINPIYYKNIMIVDNCSSDQATLDFLNTLDCKIIRNSCNNGPWIDCGSSLHIYNTLPDQFVLTDPDLEFHENLPSNFLDILCELSEQYKTTKIGFALDLQDSKKMFPQEYFKGQKIWEWEQTFWDTLVKDDNYILYNAPIDTTFHLYNKKYTATRYDLRVGGKFTAKHLPWYVENTIYSLYEMYCMAQSAPFSTSGKVVLKYIEENKIIF